VFGLNHYMKDVCRRLAKAGYFAISPDVYARKGDLTKIPSIAELLPIVNAKPDPEMMADLRRDRDVRSGERQSQRRQAWHDGILPWRPHRMDVRGPQFEVKAAVVWYGHAGRQAERCDA
jgi:dienelactone hydrolase